MGGHQWPHSQLSQPGHQAEQVGACTTTQIRRDFTNSYHFFFFFVFVREIHLPGTVGAVVPVEGSKDVIALVGRKVCLVNRETG